MKRQLNKTFFLLACAAPLLSASTALGFYDPNLQRWINRDPKAEPGDRNLYRFVENDPVSRVDPYGQSAELAVAAGRQLASICACGSMISKAMYGAEDYANQTYGVIGGMHSNAGSLADMMTHCIGACEVAKGEKSCEGSGIDPRKYLQDRERNPETNGEDKMDYENNKVGFGIADAGRDCRSGCARAFADGKLWTVDRLPPHRARPFPKLTQ